ncbi:sensor histidine kinase [Pinirhizobacter soli]|uniref:sensor histidine kinase n=1 Tax=Pinirhizobacter soli TaxID=2786953 RepID=UPI00202A44CE|nr:histidine kinase [Pinirhizobacter soli]
MKVRLGSIEVGLARYLALWTAVVLVFAVQKYLQDAMDDRSWSVITYLRWSMIQWYTWAALAPLVFDLALRFPLEVPVNYRNLGMQLVASFAITFLALVIGAAISTPFEPSSFGEQILQFSHHIYSGLLTYWALFAIQQTAQLYAEKARRSAEASRLVAELAQSRLQALRSQMQPHFLFNTLHAIATLLKEDALTAEDMLLRLSDLLRAFLDDQEGQEISLRRELVLLDLYMGIQQMRFKDRLSTRVYIQPDTLDCAVPSLILQPIVENAIRHGISQRVGADCVEVEARREGGTLRIEVRNRNSTLEPGQASIDAEPGHGIGLKNTELRLRELYGDAATVRLDMIWPEGVVCRIDLPYRELEELDDAPEVTLA